MFIRRDAVQFQIPDSRFQIPDSRFQIPDSRFQIPDADPTVAAKRRHTMGRSNSTSASCFLAASVWYRPHTVHHLPQYNPEQTVVANKAKTPSSCQQSSPSAAIDSPATSPAPRHPSLTHRAAHLRICLTQCQIDPNRTTQDTTIS
ncbi:hypothetical protein HBI24_130550 [Parastagonospora nodorum]|nr:hypothetical protein HBI32_058250 [Parastagonospora nodorum]KAH5581695.1 hypothetical protein HBI24_130550 [Parastagonospora nodorum]